MSAQDDVVPGEQLPTGNEPGADSTPADDGQGVVRVGDRTEGGAPAANQSKTEPMPPTTGHNDPDAAPQPATVEAPDLDSMNVGAADPQAPSHPSAADAGDRSGSGIASAGTPSTADAAGPALGTPTGVGLAGGDQHTSGSAFRAPGSHGTEGLGEQIETDVEASAAETTPSGTAGAPSGSGDAASVPVVSEDASPGTSQESPQTHGARTPL